MTLRSGYKGRNGAMGNYTQGSEERDPAASLVELRKIDNLTKVYNYPATGVAPVKSCCCTEDAYDRY